MFGSLLRRVSLLSAVFVFLGCNPALAADNDFYLHALYKGRWSSQAHRDAAQREFKALSTEFGLGVSEQLTSPAETLGIAGFDVGYSLHLINIPESASHWKLAVEDERPNYNLVLSRLRFRKGLPFSFELSGNLAFLHESSMMVAGVELKWALNEGFYYFPDLAVRGSINHVFGSRDLNLTTVTIDVWTSKKFAIVGMFTVAPFVGYSRVFINSNSIVMDPTPSRIEDPADPDSGRDLANFVFEQERIWANRVNFGLEFSWFIMALTFEGTVSLPEAKVGETVTMFNTKFSLTF